MDKTYSKDVVRALLDKKNYEFTQERAQLEKQIEQLRLEVDLTKDANKPVEIGEGIDLQAIEEELYK